MQSSAFWEFVSLQYAKVSLFIHSMTENSDLLQPPVKTYRRWDAAFICEGLYVGSLRATECVEALRDHNISAVLTVAGRLPVNLPEGIRHFAIDIPDFLGADLLGALHTAIPFIDSELATDGSAQRAILVHCAMGISRSVSVCCAWLMLRKSMTFQDALKLVRVNRPKALPNVGFHAQLTLLSISLQSNASDAAVEVARREYQSDDNTLLKILLTQGLQALINTIDGKFIYEKRALYFCLNCIDNNTVFLFAFSFFLLL